MRHFPKWKVAGGLAALVTIGLITTILWHHLNPTAAPTAHLPGVRELSHLTVLEVPVREVLTAKVEGRTGGTTVTAVVTGSAVFGTDLEQARYRSVDHQRKRLVLSLPPPSVLRMSVDGDAIRILHTERSGLWHLVAGSAHEDTATARLLAQMERRVSAVAEDPELIQRAQPVAERVLRDFCGELGWTVEVRWE